MAYNAKRKLEGNLSALRISLLWDQETVLTEAEIAALQSYAGFGGIPAVLLPGTEQAHFAAAGASEADQQLFPQVEELHSLLLDNLAPPDYKKAVAAMKESVLSAFYTPAFVPQTIFKAIIDAGLSPRHLFEPSAGAGVYITEAIESLSTLRSITAVEKDILTGSILSALASTWPVQTNVHVKGLEEVAQTGGTADLVVSNIPFGNFAVHDSNYEEWNTSRIHNYFFARGIDIAADGGLLAFLTTDAFLNSAGNRQQRARLFGQADLIAVAVMPDNLIKDTGGTLAPTHLIIVQKNIKKAALSEADQQLIEVVQQQNEYGAYTVNQYLSDRPHLICGNDIKPGKNQYGKATLAVWQDGDMDAIAGSLYQILSEGFEQRLNIQRFNDSTVSAPLARKGKVFTFLDVPSPAAPAGDMQLGLFDTAPAQSVNRASAYFNPKVDTGVQAASARIISTIRTDEQPDHDSIVLITAKTVRGNQFVFRLQSNVAQITAPPGWRTATAITEDLSALSQQLREFDHTYRYEGDLLMKDAFKLDSGKESRFYNLLPFYRTDTLVVNKGIVGTIGAPSDDRRFAPFHPFSRSGNSISFYNDYVGLRDAYLLFDQSEKTEDTEQQRGRLQEMYQAFTQAHGQLNLPANRRLILNDTAFGNIILSSLERRTDKAFVAADILTHDLGPQSEEFVTTDHIDALARSLNDYGRVNLEFIAAATTTSQIESITALSSHILYNPDARTWETRDCYLSGNVVQKLRQAEAACEQEPGNTFLKQSLEAISQVQPQHIPFELLDFNMGERWLPVKYYERYLGKLFETTTTVHFFRSLDTFRVEASANAKTHNEYAVDPKQGYKMNGTTLAEHALENTAPFFTYEVKVGDTTIRVPDNEAIQLAHHKIETIRNGFIEFFRELPKEEKDQIEKLYNDTFNCYVLRKYDGSHLKFSGLQKDAVGIEDLFQSQKDAAWRLIQNRGGIIDHEVGLGKTLTMIVAAHEMKRLGIINKPLILALKANVTQIAQTYRQAYPTDRLLAPSEDDFSPKNRQRLFHEIKNNNWDCIILTHDQFGKIPMSPEVRQIILQAELDNVESDMNTLSDLGGRISKQMRKGLEVRMRNLHSALKDIDQAIEKRKDTDISFSEMGIDHLLVDESHQFKNLTFTTRHTRVAGLGNMEGSQKALNMLFAIRTLQMRFDSDLNATFLSGTPISNSLTEMYLLFKYLRPKELERQGISNFDAWAAVFARKTTDFEFSVTNEIISKERFRHFIKVPELAMFYNEIADYKTAAHINQKRPILEDHLINIPPTADQAVFMEKLMAFARTGDGTLIGRAPLSPAEDKGRMLIATNYAKKMSLDMRLVSERFLDDVGNKVSICCAQIARIYEASTPYRGTQLLFCDMGTPGGKGFNIYEDIKRKLMFLHGIPEKEITFVHDWPQHKKPELFRKVNAGIIRVLLGSTQKLGIGNNVQERVVGLHQLDIPWKPSELEQSGGRGARPGNWAAMEMLGGKVPRYIYAVERSLDNYRFNLLKNKQTFISQMKNGTLQVRTIDEGAIDEKTGMNFSEIIAILSGDTSLLEKSKLEKKVSVMEGLKTAHQREQYQTRRELERLKRDYEHSSHYTTLLRADQEHYHKVLQRDKDEVKYNPIHLKDCRSDDPDQIGDYIIELYKTFSGSRTTRIGELYGYDLFIRGEQETQVKDSGGFTTQHNALYAQRPDGEIRYQLSNGKPTDSNPKLAARYFLNAIDNVDHLVRIYQKELDDIEKRIPVLERILDTPFAKDAELTAMKEELRRLEREIAITIQKNHMQQAGQLDLEAIAAAGQQPDSAQTEVSEPEIPHPPMTITAIPQQLTPAARMLQGSRIVQDPRPPGLRAS